MISAKQKRRLETLIVFIQAMEELPEWNKEQSRAYEAACDEYNELERERIHA